MTELDLILKEAGLNTTQKKFCKVPYGKNVRLLAPAGSGKTFALLWRCKYISEKCKEKELPDPRFLLIAFTRAAKLEMESRMEHEEFNGIQATVRTLNAWGWEQIKKPGKELVTTRRQKQNLINHDLLQLCKKYEKIYASLQTGYGRSNNSIIWMDLIDSYKALGFTHFMTMPEYKAHVKMLKEIGFTELLEENYRKIWTVEGLLAAEKKQKEAAVSEFFAFWKKAVVQIEGNNRYTLEDQKYWARMYFENQNSNNRYPQGITRYTHIMVDEFQDINPLDMALLQAAVQFHGQGKQKVAMTLIGDDDQAIFGWRGTSPHFILHPDKYFNIPFETCVLDTNYRSPKNIVEISSKLLSYNKEREPKVMKSAAKGKAIIKLQESKRGSSIDATLKLVDNLINNKGCEKVALIGRRQVSLFPYQVLLSSQGIRYHIDADIDIFDGEAMQSLQSIIQITYRAKDDDVDDPVEALITICDKIDKYRIQKIDKDKIIRYLERKGVDSIWDAISALEEYPETIKNYESSFFANIARKLISAETVYSFMQCIEEYFRGLDKDYNKKDTDNHYKEPQFFRLTEISKKYGNDFRKFYKDIDKARKESERSRSRSADDSKEAYEETKEMHIHLVTATRSKGHEYDAVIILDANDNEWPNHLTNDIEEERRLFYVALSRAKKYLYFMVDGKQLGSRFLLEAGMM